MQYEPIPGQPQYATEEETMAIIRAVLTEEEDTQPARKAVRFGRQNGGSASAGLRSFAQRSGEAKPHRRADYFPKLAEVEPEVPQPKRTSRLAPLISRILKAFSPLVHRVRTFRPTTRQLALVCFALLVVVRPHWFVIGGALFLGSIAFVFLLFGSDRIWRGVVAYLRRVDARDPVRGVLLRERMDWWACRWDAILDHFPDGMVDGLYMPDLQAMESAEAAHTYAMAQRLARMVHDT